jgi:hypothetical protein
MSETAKKPRKPMLRWRKQPNLPGNMSIGQLERGFELRYGKEHVASVAPVTEGFSRETLGWYFCARSDTLGIPHMNTSTRKVPFLTKEAAREACDAYVKECLEKKRG